MENLKIDLLCHEAMQNLEEFFGFSLKYMPEIIFVPDRKTIDALKGKKTEPWVVGWVADNKIYLLSRDNFEAESSHEYSNEKYEGLIKHELTHCFSDVVSGQTHRPVWLHEGISIFLSGQLKTMPKPENLCQFINFYTTGGQAVYQESGWAVAHLVNNYGKNKLLKVLKKSKDTKTQNDFAELFQSIYEFELQYRLFNNPNQYR